MRTLGIILFMLSLVSVTVFFILWLVWLTTKRPAKKMLMWLLISLGCCVYSLILFGVSAPKCEHEYTVVDSEAATCETGGYKKYHCELCGKDRTETIDELGHDMVDGVCVRCGYDEAGTIEDYKSSCVKVNYKDLLRYPDDYIGQQITITVEISQIVDNAWQAYTDNDGYGWYVDDEYYLVDKREGDAVKILEGDIVVVYGEFTSIKTVTRALTWTDAEVPRIEVKYAEFVEWQTCEEIYEEYAQKMRDAVPTLIEEFLKEAETNADGIEGLVEISGNKVSALAEIESDGTQKMAVTYSNTGESYEDYEEWAGKLWDVYIEEAGKIQDAYMEYAVG